MFHARVHSRGHVLGLPTAIVINRKRQHIHASVRHGTPRLRLSGNESSIPLNAIPSIWGEKVNFFRHNCLPAKDMIFLTHTPFGATSRIAGTFDTKDIPLNTGAISSYFRS
jgi:hypothetical protein